MREVTGDDLEHARKIAHWWAWRYPRPWLLAEDAEGIGCEAIARAAMTHDDALGTWESRRTYVVKMALFDAMRQTRYLHGDADTSLDIVVAEEDGVHTPPTLADTLPAEEPPVSADDRCDLRAALASIGPQDRLLLRLIFEDGRSVTEVGASMGLSQRNAYYARKRALEALRAAAS